MDEEESEPVGGSLQRDGSLDERILAVSEELIRYVEVVAALVIVLLFAIGVFDLGLQRRRATPGASSGWSSTRASSRWSGRPSSSGRVSTATKGPR